MAATFPPAVQQLVSNAPTEALSFGSNTAGWRWAAHAEYALVWHGAAEPAASTVYLLSVEPGTVGQFNAQLMAVLGTADMPVIYASMAEMPGEAVLLAWHASQRDPPAPGQPATVVSLSMHATARLHLLGSGEVTSAMQVLVLDEDMHVVVLGGAYSSLIAVRAVQGHAGATVSPRVSLQLVAAGCADTLELTRCNYLSDSGWEPTAPEALSLAQADDDHPATAAGVQLFADTNDLGQTKLWRRHTHTLLAQGGVLAMAAVRGPAESEPAAPTPSRSSFQSPGRRARQPNAGPSYALTVTVCTPQALVAVALTQANIQIGAGADGPAVWTTLWRAPLTGLYDALPVYGQHAAGRAVLCAAAQVAPDSWLAVASVPHAQHGWEYALAELRIAVRAPGTQRAAGRADLAVHRVVRLDQGNGMARAAPQGTIQTPYHGPLASRCPTLLASASGACTLLLPNDADGSAQAVRVALHGSPDEVHSLVWGHSVPVPAVLASTASVSQPVVVLCSAGEVSPGVQPQRVAGSTRAAKALASPQAVKRARMAGLPARFPFSELLSERVLAQAWRTVAHAAAAVPAGTAARREHTSERAVAAALHDAAKLLAGACVVAVAPGSHAGASQEYIERACKQLSSVNFGGLVAAGGAGGDGAQALALREQLGRAVSAVSAHLLDGRPPAQGAQDVVLAGLTATGCGRLHAEDGAHSIAMGAFLACKALRWLVLVRLLHAVQGLAVLPPSARATLAEHGTILAATSALLRTGMQHDTHQRVLSDAMEACVADKRAVSEDMRLRAGLSTLDVFLASLTALGEVVEVLAGQVAGSPPGEAALELLAAVSYGGAVWLKQWGHKLAGTPVEGERQASLPLGGQLLLAAASEAAVAQPASAIAAAQILAAVALCGQDVEQRAAAAKQAAALAVQCMHGGSASRQGMRAVLRAADPAHASPQALAVRAHALQACLAAGAWRELTRVALTVMDLDAAGKAGLAVADPAAGPPACGIVLLAQQAARPDPGVQAGIAAGFANWAVAHMTPVHNAGAVQAVTVALSQAVRDNAAASHALLQALRAAPELRALLAAAEAAANQLSLTSAQAAQAACAPLQAASCSGGLSAAVAALASAQGSQDQENAGHDKTAAVAAAMAAACDLAATLNSAGVPCTGDDVGSMLATACAAAPALPHATAGPAMLATIRTALHGCAAGWLPDAVAADHCSRLLRSASRRSELAAPLAVEDSAQDANPAASCVLWAVAVQARACFPAPSGAADILQAALMGAAKHARSLETPHVGIALLIESLYA